jgi:hypothetical protein
VTELYVEVIGTLAQTRFGLVKRRFLIEFDRLKLNISSSNSNAPAPSQANSRDG